MEKTREEKIEALKDLIKSDDEKFGLDRNYTLDQFEADMENASPDQMEEFLMKAIDNFDVSNPVVIETLQKYKEELLDIRNRTAIEDDANITKDIEKGKYELFKCIKELHGYNAGEFYYVYFDKPSEYLPKDTTKSLSSDGEIAKYIEDNFKETAYIVKDSGIGTLKKKKFFGLTKVVTKGGMEIGTNFSEYFEKVSK